MQSPIQLIENEITRYHGVQTLERAIAFWMGACRHSLLRQWLERDDDTSIQLTRDLLFSAARSSFGVMLAKMVRTVPESKRLKTVSMRPNPRVAENETLLHCAAKADNPEAIKLLFSLLPESEHLLAVCLLDNQGRTVLHSAANSKNPETAQTLATLLPESEKQISNSQDRYGYTVLHFAAYRGNSDLLKTFLPIYPESRRLQVVSKQNRMGMNVFQCAIRSGSVCIEAIMNLYPNRNVRRL